MKMFGKLCAENELELQCRSHIQFEPYAVRENILDLDFDGCDRQHTVSETGTARWCVSVYLHKNIIIALIVFPFDVDGIRVRALAM